VITLGAQKDNVIDILITGDDESDAYDAIQHLVDNKFGEE
jgi:phosphotransferase system HPr-like phosphotransfer protein